MFRDSFGLLTFSGVPTLGAQPEAWCVSDDFVSSDFRRDLHVSRLHVTASILAAVLFLMQDVTGTRDLLDITLG